MTAQGNQVQDRRPAVLVRFDGAVQVYLVPCRRDMSDVEVASVWYGPQDFDRIQAGVRQTVRTVRRAARDGKEADESVCDRGLEHLRSVAHMEQRKINRDCCLAALYDEQRRQTSSGIRDEEALALASMQGSRWSRDLARRDGMNDQAVAMKLRRRTAVRRYRPAMPAAGVSDILERANEVCCAGRSESSTSGSSGNQATASSPPVAAAASGGLFRPQLRAQIALHLGALESSSSPSKGSSNNVIGPNKVPRTAATSRRGVASPSPFSRTTL